MPTLVDELYYLYDGNYDSDASETPLQKLGYVLEKQDKKAARPWVYLYLEIEYTSSGYEYIYHLEKPESKYTKTIPTIMDPDGSLLWVNAKTDYEIPLEYHHEDYSHLRHGITKVVETGYGKVDVRLYKHTPQDQKEQ